MIMEKQELLASISIMSAQNLITREEVLGAINNGNLNINENSNQNEIASSSLSRHLGIAEVLYFIGGFIVFVGIAILINQNWTTLNVFTKIITTLGFGVISYLIGILLNKEEKYGLIGNAFHLIAGLVIPLGLSVTFNLAGFDSSDAGTQSLISIILFLMYLVSYIIFKKPIFTFFAIAYATWLFISFTQLLVGSNPQFMILKFNEYRMLLVGLSYLSLGYYFSSTVQRELSGTLYAFGNIFFLGAALTLGGWKPSQNIIWEIIFPGLVFGVLMLSVHLKSKAFLTFGTIFLMIYILKITGEYFSGTVGWPISLMFCGVALIGIGYYAFTLNKKYITAK